MTKVWEFQPRQYRGIDGYHRWSLAKSRGDSRVDTIVRQLPKGSDGEKAFEFECVQSNMQHGRPPRSSPALRRRTVLDVRTFHW